MNKKTCKNCKEEKSVDEFRDRRLQCKKCEAKKSLEYYHNNREERMLKQAEWRNNNKELARKLTSNWYYRNKESCLERAKKYQEDNKEYFQKYNSNYHKENRPKIVEQKKIWRKANNAKVSAIKSARYSREKKNIKLTEEDKKRVYEIYEDRDALNLLALSVGAEELFEVDHIHPLKGIRSTGLHAPWNLQILPARENAAKGNRLVYEAK